MKTTVIIIWLSLFTLPLFSYTWIPFSPDTIQAKNICFGVGSWKGVICSPDGMYLWEQDIEEWSFYTYGGLPVKGAVYFDAENILVAMGEGTFSDGVYKFNLQTKQFEVVEWLINPNFLVMIPVLDKQTDKFTDEYYIGCQFEGLYRSSDGLSWEAVSYFDGKSCTNIDFFAEYVVISEVSNISNIYLSNDYGFTWQEATAGSPMITDVKFNYDGDLYGIFPDYSNSSGLWSSEDYGNTWEVEFWSDNMSAVGFDAMGTAFVGWAQPPAGNEGIAIYTPGTLPPNLAFLNEGLPNLNINKILLNPTMSAIAIFCCTEAGVWMSYDYMVGIEKNNYQNNEISIFPNPVNKHENIKVKVAGNHTIETIDIYSGTGNCLVRQISQFNSVNGLIELKSNNLSPGIYLIRIKTNRSDLTKKLVIN